MDKERIRRPVLAILTGTMVVVAGCATAMPNPTSQPTPTDLATMAGDPLPAPIHAGSVLTYRGNAARTGEMPGPGPSGTPTVAWRFQAGGGFATSPVVDAGVVYVVSGDGVVHALTLATGVERWTAKPGGRVVASLLLVGRTVIVADEVGVVHALAEVDGASTWTFETDGPISGSPAVDGDRVVVGTQSGSIYAIDARSGGLLWRIDVGDPIKRSVAIAESVAYLGVGGSLVAIDTVDGTIRWRSDIATDGGIGTPSVSGGLVFAAVGLDGKDPAAHGVVALDVATGATRWRYASPTEKQIYTPAISADRAYVVGHDSLVVCLDAGTGAVEWSSPQESEVEALPVIVDDVVYIAANDGPAAALDATTGATQWTVPLTGVPYAPTVVDGYLLIGTDLGVLYAVGGPG